jgi:hypothetical protein
LARRALPRFIATMGLSDSSDGPGAVSGGRPLCAPVAGRDPAPPEVSPVAFAFGLDVPPRRPRPSPRTSCGLLHGSFRWMAAFA